MPQDLPEVKPVKRPGIGVIPKLFVCATIAVVVVPPLAFLRGWMPYKSIGGPVDYSTLWAVRGYYVKDDRTCQWFADLTLEKPILNPDGTRFIDRITCRGGVVTVVMRLPKPLTMEALGEREGTRKFVVDDMGPHFAKYGGSTMILQDADTGKDVEPYCDFGC